MEGGERFKCANSSGAKHPVALALVDYLHSADPIAADVEDAAGTKDSREPLQHSNIAIGCILLAVLC